MRTIRRYTMTIIFGVVAGFLTFLWFEPPFLSYENLPFPTKLAQVHPGEVIPLVVRRCNSSRSVRFYDVTHELVSADDPKQAPIILRGERVKIDPGCHEGTSTVNEVPKDAKPGRYYANGLGIVEGALRSVAVPWQSQVFEVIP